MLENTPLEPNQYPYDQYYDSLMGRNMALHSRAKDRLIAEGFLDEVSQTLEKHGSSASQDIELITSGSDGRGEKGPRSPIEIIVLLSKKVADETRERVGDILNEHIKDVQIDEEGLRAQVLKHPDFDGVEVKNLNNGPLYRYHGREGDHAIWPNRLVDTTPLVKRGRSLLSEAKLKLFDEYKKDGKKILEVERARRRRCAVTCRGKEGDETVIGTNLKGGMAHRHFDVTDGVAFYDPDNEIGSFKYGPLRLVQMGLACSITDAVHKGFVEGGRLLQDCPGNTVNKIHFLREMGVLKANFADASEYADHYKYFLWLYHQSEFAYRTSGETQTSFDSVEVKENLSNLAQLEEAFRG